MELTNIIGHHDKRTRREHNRLGTVRLAYLYVQAWDNRVQMLFRTKSEFEYFST